MRKRGQKLLNYFLVNNLLRVEKNSLCSWEAWQRLKINLDTWKIKHIAEGLKLTVITKLKPLLAFGLAWTSCSPLYLHAAQISWAILAPASAQSGSVCSVQSLTSSLWHADMLSDKDHALLWRTKHPSLNSTDVQLKSFVIKNPHNCIP